MGGSQQLAGRCEDRCAGPASIPDEERIPTEAVDGAETSELPWTLTGATELVKEALHRVRLTRPERC